MARTPAWAYHGRMDTVHLRPGQQLPDDRNWVMVAKTPAGRFDISFCLGAPKGMEIGCEAAVIGLDYAISRATPEAERLRLCVIHLRDCNASQPV